MISCKRCEELINARLDEYLTPEDAILLEDHLAQCPDCQKLDRDLTSLHEALKSLALDPSNKLLNTVMAQLDPDTIQPVKKKKQPWAAAVCAAAVVLLAVAISPQILPSGESAESATAGDTAEAPETMVMDTEPAEGGEAAPAPEESQTAAEEENLKIDPLTQEEALDRLEDYLTQRGMSLIIAPGTLSKEGSVWVFQAEDSSTGDIFQFSVSCTNGSVEETFLP